MSTITNDKYNIEIQPTNNISEDTQKDFNALVLENVKNINLKILQQILLEKNIEYDPEIKDYNELKNSLKNQLSNTVITEIDKEEEKVKTELSDFTTKLQSGGPLTLKKVFNSFNQNVLKPSAKTASMYIISRVLFDAMLFLPFNIRTIVGVASLAPAIYKSKKFFAQKKKEDNSRQYSQLIRELKIVRNTSGEVIQEVFSQEEFDIIKNYLIEKNCNSEQLSYENIMSFIDKLDSKDKLDLIKK